MNPDSASATEPEWSRTGVGVMLLCFILNMFDGVNIFTLTYVAPALQKHFAVGPEAFGIVFSAGLVGMAIGGIVVAPQADRYGRRPIIMLALALMAAAMIASAYAPSIAVLAALRVLVGIGIGTVLASISALAAGFAPPKFRNMAVGVPQAGYPVGATLAGFATAWALPVYGWSAVFLSAGGLTLILLPLCYVALPEAPEIAHHVKMSIGDALGGTRKRASALLWVATTCGFMCLYFIASWITKLAIAAGLPSTQAIIAGAIYNGGAFIGTIALSVVATRYPVGKIVCGLLLCAAAAFLVFGGVKMPIIPLLLTSFIIGVTLQGGVNGLYPLVAGVYPAEARATGLGWAMGIGRFGALVGPLIAGTAMQNNVPLVGVFGLFCVPLIIAAAAAVLVQRRP